MMYPHRLQPQLSTLRWVVSGTILLAIMTIAITEFHIETSVLGELRRRRLGTSYKNVKFSVTALDEQSKTPSPQEVTGFLSLGGKRLWFTPSGATKGDRYQYYLDEHAEVSNIRGRTLELNLSSDTSKNSIFPVDGNFIRSARGKIRVDMAFPGGEILGAKRALKSSILQLKLEATTWNVYRGYDHESDTPSEPVAGGCTVWVDFGKLFLSSGIDYNFSGCSVAGKAITIEMRGTEPPVYLQPVDSGADLEQLAKTLNKLAC